MIGFCIYIYLFASFVTFALSALKNQSLEGIVETDETCVLYSEKGKRSLSRKARKRGGVAKKRGISNEQVCILVARDRTKETISENDFFNLKIIFLPFLVLGNLKLPITS